MYSPLQRGTLASSPRTDLGHPVAFELAVVVATDVARHRARRLDHIADRAGFYGVGPQLVDHDVSPKFLAVGSVAPSGHECGSISTAVEWLDG
jgi:hypothetical protein